MTTHTPSYFLEIWARGYFKDTLKAIASEKSIETKGIYKPHITFIRPFKILSTEEAVKQSIVEYCQNIQEPIFYSLKGKAKFENGPHYVPVINEEQLLDFNNGLEKQVASQVKYREMLNEKKILHVTVPTQEGFDCPQIDQYMLRLTGMQNKRGKKTIWFSYDFITKEVLDRKESLSNAKWYATVQAFTNQMNLLPTRQGYQSTRE